MRSRARTILGSTISAASPRTTRTAITVPAKPAGSSGFNKGGEMTPEEKAAAIDALVTAWLRGPRAIRFDLTAQLVRVSIRDAGARCAYCDLDLDRYDSMHVPEHVVPLSSEHGTRDDDNVVNA